MNLLLLLCVSVCGALGTFFLAQHRFFNPVRASSFLTLVFIALAYALTSHVELWSAAFFGGSFVGMSAPHRLSVLMLTIATAVFVAFFVWLLPLLEGVGGALGLSAFLSVVIIRGSKIIIHRFKPKRA
jgi:O-antigen/teichoic acid export membrane protein